MASGCYFGAIRWDAWYYPTGPAAATRRTLGPSQYQYRAPFFAEAISTNDIQYNYSQATMTQEINFAVAGGLAYWAWGLFPQGSDMMAGYDLYQANPNKSLIKWCQIRSPSMWGSTGNYTSNVAEALAMCQQSNYFKVSTTRPLVYVLYDSNELSTYWGGSLANLKAALDAFRTACTGAGLGNPYIVSMVLSDSVRTGLGADALSQYNAPITYTSGGGTSPTPYTELDTDTRGYWDTQASTSTGEVVPICMSGWGSAPRKDRPVYWQASSVRPHFATDLVFSDATNSELVAHLQACVDWINAHPGDCPTKTALIYAWNENDEGGWLVPTLGDPTGTRLTAIKSTIET